ncbi:MAG: hypothetical protein KDM81_22145, partial [Verrucomicrobiae bacterium]|nr:hypothetical protein [Verrucomicrobiae bacterium]
MAEGLLRHRLGPDAAFEVRSAGISAAPGQAPSREAVQAMRDKGIDISDHQSHPLTLEELDQAAFVLTMTAWHREMILQSAPHASGKTLPLASFTLDQHDIEDPI